MTRTLHCSTNLLAIVEFHLDYQTSTGQPLSIKFATGKDGSVNCLLDMSFIKAAKLIVDAHNNVVESKLLECKPFDIESKHPMGCQPNLIQRNQPSAEKNLTVINAIDKACAFILTCVKSVPSVEETNNEKTKVTFNFDNKCLESKNPGEQSSQPVANRAHKSNHLSNASNVTENYLCYHQSIIAHQNLTSCKTIICSSQHNHHCLLPFLVRTSAQSVHPSLLVKRKSQTSSMALTFRMRKRRLQVPPSIRHWEANKEKCKAKIDRRRHRLKVRQCSI
jgi:hypothetical protein